MSDTFSDPGASVQEASAPPANQVISREAPDPEKARALLVQEWKIRIKSAKAHWKPDFDRMRKHMEFAKFGSNKKWKNGGNYVANIVQRHINQKVASLYAKDPRAKFDRSDRLEFQVWDGSMGSLQAAQVQLQLDPSDQTATALLQDVLQGIQRRKLFDRVGETLVILFHYFLREGNLRFKRQAKQAVRRALVTGIAYQQLGFQRLIDARPEISAQITDAKQKLSAMEALSADLADGVLDENTAEMENLRLMLKDLQAQEEIVLREGPVFDWPKSTEIILDPNTRQIEGWVGTFWIAREYGNLTAQQIKEIWKVDISKGAQPASGTDSVPGKMPISTHAGGGENKEPDKGKHTVWKVWDKRTGMEFVIADGWPEFLQEPSPPQVEVDSFFPVLALQFNPIEDDQNDPKETRIFGLSEVELLLDMQNEYNRAREGLREHRHANRPGYAVARGALESNDKKIIEAHPVNGIAELNLQPGQTIEDVLKAVPKIPIDPAVYDVSPTFDDIQRAAGSQEANLGGTSGSTATEASIAEGSRGTATQSNVDDLDDFLTEQARASGQILLLNMSRDQVTKIAGPGSVWPEFSAQEASEEVFLSVRAGSSGRPNRQLDIANFERIAPLLLQTPGIQPKWLAEQAIERLGDNLSLEDAFLDGLPSIIAQNAQQNIGIPGSGAGAPGQPDATGTPNAPEAQGGQGVNNALAPPASEGPQPALPVPGEVI